MAERRAWTQDEIALLHELYPKFGPAVAAVRLGRAVTAIRTKAYKLGIGCPAFRSRCGGRAPHRKRKEWPRLTHEQIVAAAAEIRRSRYCSAEA